MPVICRETKKNIVIKLQQQACLTQTCICAVYTITLPISDRGRGQYMTVVNYVVNYVVLQEPTVYVQ